MKAKLAIALGLTLVGSRCFAWDSFGHMAVAYVAYQNLSPHTKQRANQLLKLNPEYQTWLSWIPQNTSAGNRKMMIFMLAATWPDEIKGLPHHAPPINPVTGERYVADGSQNGDRPDGSPNPTDNTGFADNSMHKYWHFVDKPFAIDNSPLPKTPTPHAQERIALLRSTLASNASDELKSYDLAWLLHLVGDVHQPLHCTTRVSAHNLGGDNGGNKVMVGSSKLHTVWDDLIGKGSDKAILSKVIQVADNLPDADATLAADENEEHWVQESFQMAQTKVYVTPIGNGDGPFTLTTSYRNNAKQVAAERIALAGIRLAKLLDANLK